MRKFVKLLVFFTFYSLTGVTTTAPHKLPSVTGIGPDLKKVAKRKNKKQKA